MEVKIIFDDFGNIKRFSAESLQTLRDAGVEVIVFNPVHEYVNRLYFNYRDHRKITVIDGETAYTGGVNIADEYANLIDRFGYWKDSGIRLEGEGVWGLTAAFLNMWSFLGGELHEERDYYRPHTSPASDGFCQPFLDGPQEQSRQPRRGYLFAAHRQRAPLPLYHDAVFYPRREYHARAVHRRRRRGGRPADAARHAGPLVRRRGGGLLHRGTA